MARHAFLIAAYQNFAVLERLMLLLDDERNDIFLHVDRKAQGFEADNFARLCQRSDVILMPRMKVYWGDFSQVESTLRMLRAALAHGDYAYFHLLSDSDLPLKSSDEIHHFFARNDGHEFVAFNDFPAAGGRDWTRFWYPLNRLLRSPHRAVRTLYSRVRAKLVSVQRRLGIDRNRRSVGELKYGSQWFSVSNAMASHLVDIEPEVRRRFKCTFIPDEFWVQTAVWNSPFRERVFDPKDPYRSNARLIDFKRGPGNGSPLTWRTEHLDELLSSDRMFARKFDPAVDPDVIDRLCRHLGMQTRS